MKTTSITARLLALTAGLAACGTVFAQTTMKPDFTYQGVLRVDGHPVDGADAADVRVKLFGSLAGADQVGSVFEQLGVDFAQGRFSVEVPSLTVFGPSAFNGDERYLQIEVRTPGNGWTALSPRQKVTVAPMAAKVLGIDGFSLDASDGSPTDALYVGATGNVGIGTTNPQRALHVVGPAGVELRMQNTGAGGKTYHMGIAAADNSFRIAETGVADRIVIGPTGAVGINTASPSLPLSVRSDNGGELVSLRSGNDGEKWRLKFGGANELVFFDLGTGSDRIQFGTSNNNALTVKGTTTTNVLTITGGSDIAEPYNVSGDAAVVPGMVVSIDADRVGELKLSGRAYDTAVAGIISGANGVNAGLTLSQPGTVADGKHPVAMTGRVWAWCDASGGAIKAGDLLTTSDTPGHAMKASDSARSGGAVIGKAMSSLENGRGMVLVLVNLQ
jgi:hypothetical protein